MPIPDYARLVQQLVHEQPDVREAATTTLKALDEMAVDPLLDQFYAGVTEAQGIAILDMIAEIGGPDAMSTLRNTFHFEEKQPALKYAAAQGLWHNMHSLSPHELQAVKKYLANHIGYTSPSFP